jgi:hypothetical protein
MGMRKKGSGPLKKTGGDDIGQEADGDAVDSGNGKIGEKRYVIERRNRDKRKNRTFRNSHK